MSVTTLRAYHGDPAVKAKYLDRVRRHRELDHLVQGIGWEKNGTTRGCAVGCTLEAYEHERYETELGVPLMLAHLEDRIFEGLPRADALAWPERFLDAIPVGADLSRVGPRVLVRIIARRREALSALTLTDGLRQQVESALGQVLTVLGQWADTGTVDESAARSARLAASAAARAAESAARAASAAWAAMAAARAAWAAAWAAESAARAASAASAAAESAAESADEYRWLADVLCEEMIGGEMTDHERDETP